MALRVTNDILASKLRIATAMRSAGFILASRSLEDGSGYIDDFNLKNREWSSYTSQQDQFWDPIDKRFFVAPKTLKARRTI
jgi:hypothetical protein